jgi:LDH2 family malate/lactate/ureidoglycolate dehydrogenase
MENPMADTARMPPRVSVPQLEAFIERAFEAVGISGAEAGIIAALMVRADVQGSDGHGVFRLPQYIRRIKGGAVNVKPNIRRVREAAGMALVDGDNAMGHLVMRFATHTAIEKAKQSGIAWVGVRASNHAGPASLYASMALEHDMIGLYLAVGNANHLPPWGGIDMLLSTNPIAVAVPADEELPVVLDMATTVAAYGKVKTKAQRGELMPEGWMIDREGKPLLDPQRANEGFLLPIGGYKGYGLALIIGLLAGTLNGAAMGREVVISTPMTRRRPTRVTPSSRSTWKPFTPSRSSRKMSISWYATCIIRGHCPAWTVSDCRERAAMRHGQIASNTASRYPPPYSRV